MDAVVFSHGHYDHVGGLESVLRDNDFEDTGGEFYLAPGHCIGARAETRLWFEFQDR